MVIDGDPHVVSDLLTAVEHWTVSLYYYYSVHETPDLRRAAAGPGGVWAGPAPRRAHCHDLFASYGALRQPFTDAWKTI